MRHWVIGDIHGQYFALRELLEHIDIDNDDITFLGDYVDWGKYSIKTILYMIELTKDRPNIRCLIGNHDKMMLDCISSKLKSFLTSVGLTNWSQNSGLSTYESFRKLDKTKQKEIIDWMSKLEYTRELSVDDNDFYLAHAYPYIKSKKDVIWKRVSIGENPFSQLGDKYKDCTLICGHTISNRFTQGSFEVFFDKRFIILDCGAKVLDKYPKKARIAAICLEDLQPIYIDCIQADNWRWEHMKDWN